MMQTRAAFSLAEVLFALLVLALGILSLILLFPIGIRSQEQVRYQMYASIKAMELSDSLAQHNKNFSDRIHEMTGGFTARREPARLEIGDRENTISGEKIVDGAVYGSYARFDAELVWAAGGQNGVYPVPVEIARRLDSPGGEIQQVLDRGGYLFYHDPRPVRGFSLTEASNPAGSKTAPELQRLVFAVVGAPQQNALPQHPCLQGPAYLIYPFAPQGPQLSDTRLRAKVGANPLKPNYKFLWDLENIREGGINLAQWEGMNWEVLASLRFEDSPWRDGLLAFRNLCYFGWIPFEFKMRGGLGGDHTDPLRDFALNGGINWKEDNDQANSADATISRFPGGRHGIAITAISGGLKPFYWANGSTNTWAHDIRTIGGMSYLPGYDPTKNMESPNRLTVLDAFKDAGPGSGVALTFEQFMNSHGLLTPFVTPGFNTLVQDVIATNVLTEPDPSAWTYNELGHRVDLGNTDHRLPSLQQRYLYRWLALKLWRDVTVNEPSLAGSNPLVDQLWLPDGTLPTVIQLHPARVLALSHLADAAMRVGGMRLPYWAPDVSSPSQTLGITNSNATDERGKFSGSKTDDVGPRECLPADVQMAKIAHENSLRWAIAYANRFPHDNIIPRPANRQVMTDRALWQWDLFDSAGNAMRANTPDTWQGAAMEGVMPGYKVLPRPGIDPRVHDKALTGRNLPLPRLAPGIQVEGGERRYGGKRPDSPEVYGREVYRDAIANWFTRMSSATEPTFDVLNANRARRYVLNQPFAPQNRVRQLVYWAADWKGYEDSESAPSAPHGAEILSPSFNDAWNYTPTASPWNDFDPSEAPLIWFGRDRIFTYSSQFGPQGMKSDGGGGSTDMYKVRDTAGGISWSKQLGSIRNFFDKEGLNHTFGLFGADRDGNGSYRGGSIKSSVRLRAIEVARFNFYDPVVWCHLRK